MYKIAFSMKAAKTFLKLHLDVRDQLSAKLELLAKNPYSKNKNVSSLKGMKNAYRLRLNDWRIIYEISKETVTIVIIKIGQRKEVYRS